MIVCLHWAYNHTALVCLKIRVVLVWINLATFWHCCSICCGMRVFPSLCVTWTHCFWAGGCLLFGWADGVGRRFRLERYYYRTLRQWQEIPDAIKCVPKATRRFAILTGVRYILLLLSQCRYSVWIYTIFHCSKIFVLIVFHSFNVTVGTIYCSV